MRVKGCSAERKKQNRATAKLHAVLQFKQLNYDFLQGSWKKDVSRYWKRSVFYAYKIV